jgi:hypothetical protein
MWDASTPPQTLPTGYDAAAGYVGGDTPHVWTLAEWRNLGSLPKLPIWVRSNPPTGATQAAAQGKADAFAALEQLYKIGCPRGYTVALDLETAVSGALVNAFGSVMRWAGFYVWVYGSKSTVFGNPGLDGYWVADYTGQPHFATGPDVRATQWTDGPAIDKSLVKWWSWRNRLWR